MGESRVEKRTAPRHKVLKGGTIAFDGNGLACMVSLPPTFKLMIERDQFIRRCHPVWRNHRRIGVAFDQGADS